MEQISTSILISLIEAILQSRVDVQKRQIRRFDEVNKEFQKKRQKAFDSKLQNFLDHLLITEKFRIRQLIQKKQQQHNFVQISLSLGDRYKKKNKIMAEIWVISFQEFIQFSKQYSNEEFFIISNLFEEMLLFLNQQPLFHEYQRNSKIKDRYIIDYQIELLPEINEKTQKKNNILELANKCIKQRVCKYLGINIVCYFVPKTDTFWEKLENKPLMPSKESIKKEQATHDTTKHRKSSEKISGDRLSYYEIYDRQLDFVFLSSDDEELKRHQEDGNEIKEIDIGSEESEEFEMLTLTQDEEFVNDNRNLILELTDLEHQYLII